MHKRDVRTLSDALAYITDCTLATVCDMASRKTRSNNEFKRQIAIAQTAIDWMQQFGVNMSTTRAEDAISSGGVNKWAEQFIPKSVNSPSRISE